ncbi:DNA polymerase III subunit alpha [Persicitalea jodogahamensis]|uniref:DNA-directed DNA polymerase n=1 Tax=Persicitalea jodogahamensis TaxID=402147 RepID=A0A8J3D754_9BACT|nr:DNA polymerase III subunit alpha [Persicitalea jodogahamensis]GHB82787.1 DNA-directed DNA polymerase [Persicitalea jodogahamensis]
MLLNLHSYYSLRYGTMSVADLVEGMRTYGYDMAVLTDINNSTGTLEFVKACREAGLLALAGMEYRDGDRLLYTGIAANEIGFRELNELMTCCNRDKVPPPETAPAFDRAFVVYPYGSREPDILRDHEYIGVPRAALNRVAREPIAQRARYVIHSPVSFRDGAAHRLHTQLRAIDHNLLISQLQPGQIADPSEVFVPKAELLWQYRNFPDIIRNTEQLLQSCSFYFDFDKAKNKKTFTGNPYDDKLLLQRYAFDGLARRYGPHDKVARERVQKEIEIIDNLHFSSYFLITDDICRYAVRRNFHYVGRGSGANSVVAYCLGITDVDPIALDLYFERFLNPKRKTPPDFDIDFSWDQRDEMYDFIFKRYQSGHTALMGAMSTFRSRSILRELGKVYGLPKGEIDRLVHEPESMMNKNEVVDMILSVYSQMEDFPNQRTIHASGVLISELPLTNYCALDYPPKGLPTMQFDMYTAEDICFEKFDILSQRGIGHIKECVKIVAENRGVKVDISQPHDFLDDPKIADQLRSANTIGCFYIESPAMRQLIAKLKCDNYLTLVAASSIIRPGVASSGMMKAYIERHHDPGKVQYLHPVMERELQETYGVMVYQEDVMRIGHHFGGLDLADADVLRRMMSGKTRSASHLAEIEDKFFAHCQRMNYPEETSREVWRQMESFAGYSFNKAHSASFAVESYQSLYLKTYFPIEFMVAVLNNYGGFYQRKVYVNELRRAWGDVHLPCVNRSQYGASVQGTVVHLGFDCLLNLESGLAQRIPKERERNGKYSSLENFALRTGARLEQLVVLIRSGAFRFLGSGKKELLWEAHLLLNGRKNDSSNTPALFAAESEKPMLPALEGSLLEDLYDEIELLGFPVSASLFSLTRSDYAGEILSRDLTNYTGRTVRMVGDFVCSKTVRTKQGKLMKFGTFLDTEGDFFDTVHFPPSLQNYPLYGNGVYLVEGKVVEDFGCPGIEVQRVARMPLKPDPRGM